MNRHDVPARPLDRLAPFAGQRRVSQLHDRLEAAAGAMAGRRLVNVTGDDRCKGGVFEILRGSLPYLHAAGIDVQWVDLTTPASARGALEYFHVLAHGRAPSPTWARELPARRRDFAAFAHEAGQELKEFLRQDDVVVLHDTQTALLAQMLADWTVVWHAHIGTASHSPETAAYWATVGESVESAQARMFYRPEFAPKVLHDRSVFITPCVDPSTPKSALLPPGDARAILASQPTQLPCLTWLTPAPALDDRAVVVAQISRWDPLKDMAGALRAMACAGEDRPDLVGIVAGPAAESSLEMRQLDACLAAHAALGRDLACRIAVGVVRDSGHPTHDMAVRVLQSAADIVVQKSIEEGFGLTVTEAMLRGKAVIASCVGGIPLQLRHEFTGLLLRQPHSVIECAQAITQLAGDHDARTRLGAAARADVLEHHIVDRQLSTFAATLRNLTTRRGSQ